MLKKKTYLVPVIAVILAILITRTAKADSPLTSTDFYTAYIDYPVVQKAIKARGKLTPEIMKYLGDTSNPIEIKLAAINAIGWQRRNTADAELLKDYLFEQRFGSKSLFRELGKTQKADTSYFWDTRPEDLICYAYLKSLENYFSVGEAYRYALAAVEKSPKSYSINIIAALIKAQIVLDTQDFCLLFNIVNSVKKNKNLNQDLKPEANEIIFNYINSYGDKCI
jgi:hypothetical protein